MVRQKSSDEADFLVETGMETIHKTSSLQQCAENMHPA